jgi:hypothetical protein
MGCIISAIQGPLKGKSICRAVAFEHQSAQAQQGSAVVAAMVNALFKGR